MTQTRETTTQAEGGKKPNWRCGAPAGNQNAAKPLPTLSRKVRALKRRIRKALKAVPQPKRRRLARV